MGHGVPDTLTDMLVPVEQLRPYGQNPRRGNVELIADSLRANGQYRPVVVNRRTNEVLAGNHTLAAAQLLGWDQLAATWVDVDDDAAARIVLIDNRANDLSGYDDQALAQVLDSLPDLGGTGYNDADLARLLADTEDRPELTDPDDAPAVTEHKTIARRGDVFVLGGEHRVMCGDATSADDLAVLVEGRTVDAVWTGPRRTASRTSEAPLTASRSSTTTLTRRRSPSC